MTMKLASSPSRKSSITTRAPALPIVCATSIASIAACASSTRRRDDDALAGGEAVGLDDDRRAARVDVRRAPRAGAVNVRDAAVGMPWRFMNAFAKSFELSSCAAARVGPKMRSPAARNASTMPAASGASGPTTVSPTASRRANATSSSMSVIGDVGELGSRAPCRRCPGATNTCATRGDCASFHASACSRPPPPMTRTFTRLVERDAAEREQRAAVVEVAATASG